MRLKDIVISIYNSILKKRSLSVSLLLLALFSAGFGAGWFSRTVWLFNRVSGPVRESRLSGYGLINPLLECDPSSESIGEELLPFRYKINALIEEQKRNNRTTHVSVYFREMNNGLSFNIHGQEKFTPASLLKVPLLIAYLKWAEKNPDILSRRIRLDLPDQTTVQRFKPSVALQPGNTCSIEELLYHAIVYSDNTAYFLLFASIDPEILHHVYTDLGLEVPTVRTRDDYMSVVEYASFFRMLYNASYVSKDLSNKALQFLSEVEFRQGIVAGVPAGTIVAHKFGEYAFGAAAEIKQLHDCGIVYYPDHPYLLCVMSRGDSFEYLDDSIREISRLIYEEVDRQHHTH